ncbi:MAG: metal-dependent transcriptional regulator [Caldilineaceae bacterium]|nr:metal-dependent transcriptional regulator [Caldilineaceae bacterium]
MQTFCGITTDGMLDYLAAIYKLGGDPRRDMGKVTTSALAEKMHVSAAAASSMLKRLEESGFVERSNVDGITLTEQGRLAALQLIRRHRLLEVFLVKIMGFTWDQVDAEAYRLEHAISSAFEDRMDSLCGYPTHCPHGDPIPRKDGTIPEEYLLPVIALEPGQQGMLQRVGTNDARVLRYLSQLKLEPGCTLRLIDLAPFNGPVTLEVLASGGQLENQNTQMLGSELAAKLFVRVKSPGVVNGS